MSAPIERLLAMSEELAQMAHALNEDSTQCPKCKLWHNDNWNEANAAVQLRATAQKLRKVAHQLGLPPRSASPARTST